MATQGVLHLDSPLSVPETADRVQAALSAKGMKIFARIDQAAEAVAVGLTLRPTILLIFGNPKAGTPLMDKYPELALEMPLKTLIWQTPEGKTRLSFTSPQFLQQRYGLPITPFAQLPDLLAAALK